MDNLHVLVLPSFYPTEDKPLNGKFFQDQSEYLLNYNIKVGIVYNELRSMKEITLKKVKKYNFKIKQYNENGITLMRRHSWNIIPTKFVLGNKLWMKKTIKLCDKYIQLNGRPNIIHAHCTLWGGVVANYLSKKYNIPYIITEHSTVYSRNNLSTYEKNIAFKALRQANKVLMVSKSFMSLLSKYFNYNFSNMEVVANYIDTEFFNLSRNRKYNNEFTFISIAFLSEKKGFERLIRCFHEVFKDNSNVKLKIGGDGPLREKLHSLVDKLGINNQIIFLGQLNRQSVKEQLNEANAFVLTSDVETFGIVFVEAMSTGMPVIGTICGGPEDFINKEVGLLINKDDEEVRNALFEMYNNYNHYNQKNIRNYVINNYSNKIVSQKIIDIYNELI